MNRHVIEGKWRQFRGKVKAEWGDLTDNDLKQVAGNYDQLVGKIQEKYGQAREEIEQRLARLSGVRRTAVSGAPSSRVKMRRAVRRKTSSITTRSNRGT